MDSKIKRFEKVISENKHSMLQIIVLYNMTCSEFYRELTESEKEKLLGIIYNFYIKDEYNKDMGQISDVVMEHHSEILKLLDENKHQEIRQKIYELL